MLELREYRSLLPLPRKLKIFCSIINIDLGHSAEPSLDFLLYWSFLFKTRVRTTHQGIQETDENFIGEVKLK